MMLRVMMQVMRAHVRGARQVLQQQLQQRRQHRHLAARAQPVQRAACLATHLHITHKHRSVINQLYYL